MSEEPYDASNPEHVREARTNAKRRAVKRKSLIKSVMNNPEGRKWIYELLSSCHVFVTSFDTNALKMAFQEGQRDIGLHIYADLMSACPELYKVMLEEIENG